MKNVVVFILFLAFPSFVAVAYAQTAATDSLVNRLQVYTAKDTVRVNLLNQAAYKLYLVAIDKTLRYAKEAEELSIQLGYKKGQARSLVVKGIYYDEKSDFSKALNAYSEALALYEELNDKNGITNCYNNMGILYRYQGNYPRALEYYQKSLKIAEELNDQRGISRSSNNIGIVYFYQSNYSKALEYYQKSLTIDEAIGDKNGISYSMNNIGIIYEFQKNYPKALEFYQKSLAIKEELADKAGIATSLYNIGTIKIYMHDFQGAYSCYQKSLKISRDLERKSTECYNYIGLSNLFVAEGKTKEAYHYALKANKLAKGIGSAEMIKESAELVAKSASELGLYKEAFEYHVAFKRMNDSLYNEQSIKDIARLEFQYIYEKEKKLAELEEQKKEIVQLEKEKTQRVVRNALMVGLSLMLLLVVVVLRSLLQKRKANRLLSAQKEEIRLQAEKVKTANKELRLSNATKDKFFSIVSHDLKSPFNAIFGFSELLLTNYEEYNDEERLEHLKIITDSSKKAFRLTENLLEWSRIQRNSMTFNPEKHLVKKLLGEVLDNLDSMARQKSIKIIQEVSETMEVYADKLMLKTILRNVISNAIKFTHAGGTIIVEAKTDDEHTILSVVDEGVGMPQEKMKHLFDISQKSNTVGTNNEPGTGLGLVLCKELSDQHKGTISVESEIGRGTTFRFSFPHKSEE